MTESTQTPQPSYQESVTRIQEIVRLLETGDIEVDELTKLIEEATGLLQFCSTRELACGAVI